MEENKVWEQLETNAPVQPTAVDSEILGTDGEGASSQYGKFKDANSLFKAYNELQSEFTRKCQRLSELETKTQDNAALSAPRVEEESWQDHVDDFIKNILEEINSKSLN